jgi:hypothetical protein
MYVNVSRIMVKRTNYLNVSRIMAKNCLNVSTLDHDEEDKLPKFV